MTHESMRIFPNQKPWFNTDVRDKIKKCMQPSNQERSQSINALPTTSRNPSGLPQEATIRNLKAATGETTQEDCGKESKPSPTTGQKQADKMSRTTSNQTA